MVDIVPLRDLVIVEIPEVGRKEFLGSDVFPADEGSPLSSEATDKGNQKEAELPLGLNVERSEDSARLSSSSDEKVELPRVASIDDGSQRPSARNFPPRRNDRSGRRPGQKSTEPVDNNQNKGPMKGGKPGTDRRPDPRWKKKPDGTNRQSGQAPDQPKTQANDVSQTRTNKDQRRKKGNRRDFNEDKNRT